MEYAKARQRVQAMLLSSNGSTRSCARKKKRKKNHKKNFRERSAVCRLVLLFEEPKVYEIAFTPARLF
jgi:hypothetical protein